MHQGAVRRRADQAFTPEAAAVIMRALRKDPADRYASAQAFADAMAPFATPASAAPTLYAPLASEATVHQPLHAASSRRVRPVPILAALLTLAGAIGGWTLLHDQGGNSQAQRGAGTTPVLQSTHSPSPRSTARQQAQTTKRVATSSAAAPSPAGRASTQPQTPSVPSVSQAPRQPGGRAVSGAPVSVPQRVARLRGMLAAGHDSGAIETDTVRDLDQKLDELLEKVRTGEREPASEKVRDLRHTIEERVRDGKMSHDRGAALLRVLAPLERQLPVGQDSGDGNRETKGDDKDKG